MNAIASMLRAEFYNDTTRNARFYYSDINKAFNDAVQVYIGDKFSDRDGQRPYSFQSIQKIRSDLATLIKNASPAITTLATVTTRYGSYVQNHINYPTDYQELIAIWPLIDGYTDYSRPMTYNNQGPLLNNSFRKPTNKKTYYNEDTTGLTIWRGNIGTFISVTLEYLRGPVDFSVGNESNLITTGGTLVSGSSYIAVDDSVESGNTYIGGTQFTSGSVTLTSGTVILASLTSPIDLPDKVHEQIAKKAAAILSGVISDYPRSQYVTSEENKG